MEEFCSKAGFSVSGSQKCPNTVPFTSLFALWSQKVQLCTFSHFWPNFTLFVPRTLKCYFCFQNSLWRLGASITTPPTRRKLKVAHVFFYNFHINDFFHAKSYFHTFRKIQSCNATELLQKIQTHRPERTKRYYSNPK